MFPQTNYNSGQQSGNILDHLLPMALQIAGMAGGEMLGGPIGAAAGAGLGNIGADLLTGQSVNPTQVGESALFGLLPGAGLAKLGEKAAGTAAEEAAGNTAERALADIPKDNSADVVSNESAVTNPSETAPTTDNNTIEGLLGGKEPTNINPETNMGHINFTHDANGNPIVDNNNVFAPPKPPQSPENTPISNLKEPPQQPPASGTQTSPDDEFTQVNAATQPRPNFGQQVGNGMALDSLKKQVQQGGSRLTQAEADKLASNLNNDGYASLQDAARDANLTTGSNGILSNGVNDHINNAETNGAATDLRDYNQLAANHIREGMSSGVLAPRQQKAAVQTLNDIKHILGGPNATYDPTGELSMEDATHVLPSNVIKAVRTLQDRAAKQDLIAQGRGPAADGAKQMSQIYSGMANNLMDRAFGGDFGNAAISDDNINNMINQVKSAPYINKRYQQELVNKLESGKGGKLSVAGLRHLQANHVRYANAASPNEVSNLTNGLMSAGLSKTGITNAVLNSTHGLVGKAKLGQLIAKGSTAPSDTPEEAEAVASSPAKNNIINNTVGRFRGMSPIMKAAMLAGIGGGGLLGLNGLATENQGAQAQAMLNDPEYQKTQALLQQQNALQRYLGEEGALRSVFAPTFDTNAGQAGQEGQSLLAAANQNQASRTAAANLLLARARLGQGGLLGGLLSMIPGTSQNAYAQQARNAQAQLNSLGVAGETPSVMQNVSTLPALTSMAGNVGNF